MKRGAIVAFIASVAALLLVMLLLGGPPLGSSPPEARAQLEEPHYKCYTIAGPAVGVPVTLKTAFGSEAGVEVGTPSHLCLPAGKNGQPIPDVPHLKCYNIAASQNPPNVLRLVTQFGVENNVAVGQARELCVPVNKQVAPEPPGPEPPPTVHYECYDITGPAPTVPPVELLTQFGLESGVVVEQPTRLCAPALKNGEGDLGLTHLKCYNIAGAAPGVLVNLTTQFGIEANVAVGPPARLCAPIDPVPVGGIAEVSGLAGASAEEAGAAAEGSGWSASNYAALGIGLAVAAVALSAGAWYARRRLLG